MTHPRTRRGFFLATTALTAAVAGCGGDQSNKKSGSNSESLERQEVDEPRPTRFPRLPAENAAGVDDINGAFPAGDVRRYGALGDGVADDTAAIQTAISIGAHTSNWCVNFSQGIYRIRSPISDAGRAAGSKLLLNGNNSVILVDVPGGEFLRLASSGAHVSSLLIDARLAGYSELSSAAITIVDASEITIDVCTFDSIPNFGIRIHGAADSCSDLRISGCNFNGCRGTAVHAETAGDHVRVERLFVHDCAFVAPASPNSDQTRAVHLASGTYDSRISGNSMTGVATADYSSGWRDAVMIGHSHEINKPIGIMIADNTITGMADDGVGLSGAHKVVIQGNIIFGSLVTAGIYCPADSTWTNKDVLISGNTLFNHHLAGIYLKDTETYTITGNKIHDCPDGIMIVDTSAGNTAVDGGIVSNNLIHHVGRCGILCEGGRLTANSNSISHFGTEAPPPQTRRCGIFLSSLGSGSSISGNTIVNGRHGIVLTGAINDFVLSNNTCSAVSGYGVYFIDFQGNDWIISGNRLACALGQSANRPAPTERTIWTLNL